MTYLNRHKYITASDEFLVRVLMAAVHAAIDINAEPPTGYEQLDSARTAFARLVLLQPNKHARLLANGVVVHEDASANMDDAGIYKIVKDIWNAYAGVKPTQA